MVKVSLDTISAEELSGIARMAAGELTHERYRADFRRGSTVTRRLRNEYQERYGTPEPAAATPRELSPDPTFTEALSRMNLDSDLWASVEKAQELVSVYRHTDIEANVTIDDDAPVMVVFMSDLHVGHTNCNMRKIREDCEIIANTPGMFVIFGGDMTDNVNTLVAGRGSFHETLTPNDIQKELVERLAEFLGPEKILAMLLGNHDEWSMKTDGFDPVRYLAKHVGAPYLGPFGYINVGHGDNVYRILAAHQFRMNSSFNKTHAAKRLMDFVGDAHVVFTGHKHDPASEQVYVRREKRFYAQSGSYLKSSVYGTRLGFTESTAEMPGVLLYPDRFKFVGVFNALDEGVDFLESARARYASEQAATIRKKAA